MSKKAADHHRNAAEHHTHAAHHHGEAAKHHDSGYHEKAAHMLIQPVATRFMQEITPMKPVRLIWMSTARNSCRPFCPRPATFLFAIKGGDDRRRKSCVNLLTN
jgi:hypothetical protein